MKLHDFDANVKKVTVSIPADLFAWGEEERAKRKITRSRFVADLYRRYLEEVENDRRIERYAAAYAKQPETDDERAWASAAAEALFGETSDW